MPIGGGVPGRAKRQLLPFALLGFDMDNGGGFLNHEVLEYCQREGPHRLQQIVAQTMDCYNLGIHRLSPFR